MQASSSRGDRAAPRPASGRLGVLTPGLGAVATTFIAGVESVRRGHAKPIGSLTQMATIRLGQRTERRSPLIKDFVPLAELDDLVFGAWDPIADDALTAACKAGVLEERDIERVADFLRGVTPMPAAFDQHYVQRISGSNVKRGIGEPVGSHSQMGAIRLGKRTEVRNPLIKDFVPLAALEDIVFGSWDIFPD